MWFTGKSVMIIGSLTTQYTVYLAPLLQKINELKISAWQRQQVTH